MPTLKEIKGRIASVKSTLKITSAMKLVSSAKLRKAQKAIEAMRPYQEELQRMLALVSADAPMSGTSFAAPSDPIALAATARTVPKNGTVSAKMADFDTTVPENGTVRSLIVAIASNSSLCGGFNANAIAKVRSVRRPGDVVLSVGRKMADAMRKDGFPSSKDLNALVEHPAYSPAAALVEELAAGMAAGKWTRVLLVYNHFVSTAKQVPVVEELMSGMAPSMERDAFSVAINGADAPQNASASLSSGPEKSSHPVGGSSGTDIIVEPGAEELWALLQPKTLKLKLYAALLDSAAAEHAARTVAMQTATDNGNSLLEALTLQYNKGRQQKITSEILDLAGAQAAS